MATLSSTDANQLTPYRYKLKNKSYCEDLGAGVNLVLMLIPAGEFMMGAPKDELDSSDRERPQHPVELSEYLMGRYPVTQAQWRVVAGYERSTRDLDPDPSYFKGDNRPVERVSWEDAQEFCQRLSTKTGRHYCLPSEAQWEYACRAGMTTAFHFGAMIIPELGNYYTENSYNGSPTRKFENETTEVGRFPANDWGLCDMHGNVWEWCEDDWHENYVDAPKDGSAWVERDRTETSRLLRGGSWDYFPEYCRCATRNNNTRDNRNNNVGFRVCCVPPSTLHCQSWLVGISREY